MRRILVAGLPRSGTSWIGRAIGNADGATFVHEPDGSHEPFAIKAKRGYGRHIALDHDAQAPLVERMWSGAFSGGDRTPNLRARVAKRLMDPIPIGERTAARHGDRPTARMQLVLALATPQGPVDADHVVVKTVLSSFCIEWVASRFDPQIVVIERDPRNAIASWIDMRMAGDPRENANVAQEAQKRWGISPPDPDSNRLAHQTFVFAALSCALRDAALRHPDWDVVRHEEFCVEPRASFPPLLSRLGLEYGQRCEDYLTASNQAGEGFRTQRLTAAEPERWRERLTDVQLEVVAEQLARFPHDLRKPIAHR